MDQSQGCSEYNKLSRRQFVAGTGKLALAAGALTALLPKVSLAQGSNSNRDIVLQVYLRGGSDGLSMCVPFGEDAYYAARPSQAVARPDSNVAGKAINLDGFFGAHPALQPLIDAYMAKHLLFVHATGLVGSSRSHFETQRWMETGAGGVTTLKSGWLGRHLSTTAPMNSLSTLRGASLGPSVPLTLFGGPSTAAVPSLVEHTIQAPTEYEKTKRMDHLRAVYSADATETLRTNALSAVETVALLGRIDFPSYTTMSTVAYPDSEVGIAFKSAAALIRSDVGVEAMTIDMNGWDTHALAGVNGGYLHYLLADLAESLGAFYHDMVAANRIGRITVVVMSEFGRRVAENGSTGTDHGYGGAMMVLGGGVNGGRVLTKWPGLGNLFEDKDLQITIDYRHILAEIVAKRLDNPANLSTVFPNFTPTFQGAVF